MQLTLTPKTTALVLIDLQTGILGMPLAPHNAQQVITAAVKLATSLKKAGGLVIPVRVAFSPDLADRPQQPVDEPMRMPPGGLPAAWSDLTPDIAALAADIVITKRQWGAFFGTELDLQLRRRGITTIILAGIATNFGVEQTAREAWQHNYEVVIAEDACTSVSAEMHAFAIAKILPRLSLVRTTEEILASLPTP